MQQILFGKKVLSFDDAVDFLRINGSSGYYVVHRIKENKKLFILINHQLFTSVDIFGMEEKDEKVISRNDLIEWLQGRSVHYSDEVREVLGLE